MSAVTMPLKGLPADARPREKLLQRGPTALSDAELLALLLRTGVQGKNVIQLAQELVDKFGGIAGLLHSGAEALKDVKGLGPAKRAELMAVVELARRALAQELKERPLFDSPTAVAQYLQLHLGHKPHEVFAVLFLDSQHRLLALEELFRGTLSKPTVAHYTNNYMAEQSPSRALEATRAVMQKRQRWHGTRASCRLETPTCRLVARRPLAALSTPHGLK